jgi:hypothetical protein
MNRRQLALGLACLVATFSYGVGVAKARTTSDVRYTKTQSYSTALRLLRIDLGYAITERDAEAAYLLFEFEDEKKTQTGSIEIVPNDAGVTLAVRLPKLPSYRERMLRDELMRKLVEDYGTAPDAPKAPKGDNSKDEKKPRDDDDPNAAKDERDKQ